MVFVSTRIKKAAAMAYDAELIESPTYRIRKAEGLICPAGTVGSESLKIHSAGFGDTEATESIYKAEASLSIDSAGLADVRERLKAEGLELETTGQGGLFARGFKVTDGVERLILIKAEESHGRKTFVFAGHVLRDDLVEFEDKFETMIKSFELK